MNDNLWQSDIWERADINDQDGLDPEEFAEAFRGHYPPWRKPVGALVTSMTLDLLFRKIDANGDGRVSWEEFGDFVLSEAMQRHQVDKVDVRIFDGIQEDNKFNDESAYHLEVITDIVNLSDKSQYLSCSRDGTIRIWGSTSLNHIQTIRIPDKSSTTWITGATKADGLKSALHPKGILVVIASDRSMRMYDIKSFAFLGMIMLPDDVSPLCCSGFTRKDVLRRMKTSTEDHFIVIGDAEGKILVYEQVILMSRRDRPSTCMCSDYHCDTYAYQFEIGRFCICRISTSMRSLED